MSSMYINLEDEEYKITIDEMVDHLEENGYAVIGDAVNSLDSVDRGFIEEIIQKFLASDYFCRVKLHNKIIRDDTATFHEYNRMDMFDYLDQTGFDFLDNIDSQEMISHLENVGYKICEE